MSYRPSRRQTVTIPSGDTDSEVIKLLDGVLMGIITPALLTSTSMTVKVCDTPAGTFLDLVDSEGNTPTLTVTTSTAYGLVGTEIDAVAPWPYAKLVGGSSEAADRDIVVCSK